MSMRRPDQHTLTLTLGLLVARVMWRICSSRSGVVNAASIFSWRRRDAERVLLLTRGVKVVALPRRRVWESSVRSCLVWTSFFDYALAVSSAFLSSCSPYWILIGVESVHRSNQKFRIVRLSRFLPTIIDALNPRPCSKTLSQKICFGSNRSMSVVFAVHCWLFWTVSIPHFHPWFYFSNRYRLRSSYLPVTCT